MRRLLLSALAASGFLIGAAYAQQPNLVAVNAQTGATYTAANTDCGKLVTFSGTANIAMTLPQPSTPAGGGSGSGYFYPGCAVYVSNLASATLTITPTSTTIDGVSPLTIAQGAGAVGLISDGTAWHKISAAGVGTPAGQNILQNSDFLFDQVNAGGSISVGTSLARAVDRWYDIYTVSSSGGSAPTTQQVALSTGLTVTAEELKLTNNSSGATSNTAGMITRVQQTIEGADVQDLNWGSTSGVPVTVSGWLKSSVSGAVIGVSLKGASTVQSYVQNCTTSTTVWTFCSFVVPAPATGTWTISAGGAGPVLSIAAQCGTTFQTTAGAWATGGPFYCTSTQTQMLATNSSTLELAAWQIQRGVVATPWVADPSSVAYTKVRRYLQTSFPLGTAAAQNAGVAGASCLNAASATSAANSLFVPLSPPLYAAPTITTYSPSATNANWYDITGSAGVTVTVDPGTAKGTTGFEIATGAGTTAAHVLCIHWLADSGI
jgi:hypothetical protein